MHCHVVQINIDFATYCNWINCTHFKNGASWSQRGRYHGKVDFFCVLYILIIQYPIVGMSGVQMLQRELKKFVVYFLLPLVFGCEFWEPLIFQWKIILHFKSIRYYWAAIVLLCMKGCPARFKTVKHTISLLSHFPVCSVTIRSHSNATYHFDQ